MAITPARFNCRLRPFASINVADTFYTFIFDRNDFYSGPKSNGAIVYSQKDRIETSSYRSTALSFIIPSSSLGVATTKASLEDNRARRVFTVFLVGT